MAKKTTTKKTATQKKTKRTPKNEFYWQQLPDENAEQYAKFCTYRDMRYLDAKGEAPTEDEIRRPDLSIRRSLRRTAAKLGCTRKNIEPLSARFDWVGRAGAYDTYINERIREKNEEALIRMNERHAALAVNIYNKVAAAVLTLPSGELGPQDIARLTEVAVKTERLARGESTENQSINGSMETRHEEKLDLSRLSDDELRRLAALGGESHGSTKI